MIIYNLSLFLVFSTLFQFYSSNTRTLHAFSDLGPNNFLTKVLTGSILSMAGVPPFWGFFAKTFLFTILATSNFVFVFMFFFTLLFLSLYFYIQNIRFLNSTSFGDYVPARDRGVRVTTFYIYASVFVLFLLMFGFAFTEDLLLLVN
jgi:NADH:ubiquinone oxidoreductase subunit 2 (subunit N)